jgi:GNAT superfamily N-acetyltransferase
MTTDRAATVDDAAAISALVVSLSGAALLSPDGAGAEGFFASVSEAAIRGYVQSPRYDFRVSLADDGRLAAIGAMRDNRHLFELFVAPSHQGHGLARRLWTALHEAALARGNPGAFTVNATLAAQAMYERFGFVATGPAQRVHGIAFQPMRLGDVAALPPLPAPPPSDPPSAPR